jgi:hypothetical protein
MLRVQSVRLDPDKFSLRGATPVVGAGSMEESASQAAKREDEFARIISLKSGCREF